jgi:hypothetical protein
MKAAFSTIKNFIRAPIQRSPVPLADRFAYSSEFLSSLLKCSRNRAATYRQQGVQIRIRTAMQCRIRSTPEVSSSSSGTSCRYSGTFDTPFLFRSIARVRNVFANKHLRSGCRTASLAGTMVANA